LTPNPSAAFRGTVEKVTATRVCEPERPHIVVEGAEHLYQELRIENILTNSEGKEVQLIAGALVEIIVTAQCHGVIAKKAARD